MATSIRDWCLERLSSAPAPDEHSRIIIDVALLRFLALLLAAVLRTQTWRQSSLAVIFFPPLSLRQPLPRLGLIGVPPKLLRRFLRGCVVATAHGLVDACDDARAKLILRSRIFARVMSGVVMREEGRLQAAAAARIASKSGVINAVLVGDVAGVLSHLIADAHCVEIRN